MRLVPYFILIVLLIGYFLYFSSYSVNITKPPLVTSTDAITSTSSISTLSTTTLSAPQSTTTPGTKSTASPQIISKPKNTTKTKLSIPVLTPVPTVTPLPTPNFEVINQKARESIVNIICTTKSSGSLSPITGTGVLIDPKGVILTNAHIAQYFLLKDFREKDFVECVIRTGSPAYPTYTAELMYISPTWIERNKDLLNESNPLGTGQNDFALLRITGAVGGNTLPSSFHYISPLEGEVAADTHPVVLVSYPAGFLGGMSILQDLNITSAIAEVKEVFTFETNTVDLISVPNTVVSQKGSSGGAVVDKNSKLIGLISTTSEGDQTNKRDLRAITMGHINRTLKEEVGMSLSKILSGDIASFAALFQKITTPLLTGVLEIEILK